MKTNKKKIRREYFLGEEREDRANSYLGDWDYYIFASVTVIIEGKDVSVKCHCGYVWCDSGGSNFAEKDYSLSDLINIDECWNIEKLFRVIRKGKFGKVIDEHAVRCQFPSVTEWKLAGDDEKGEMVFVRSYEWVSEKNNADDFMETYGELVRSLLLQKIKAFKLGSDCLHEAMANNSWE